MKRYLTEFIGTFFLVLTIGLTVIPGHPFAGLAIGGALMIMVYMGGHVSGGHYNPAVTLGVFMRGKCPSSYVVPYMVAQLAGAAVASGIVMFFKAKAVEPFYAPIPAAFAAELLFTFALVYVVLNVATARATDGNSYFGLAIGFTVLAGAFAVGDISGGAFNPAVAVGASLMGLLPWANIWLYVVAAFLGAVLAAVAFKIINAEEVARAAAAPSSHVPLR